MENDADHNVGRMKLDHAPAQVAPPWFLVTRAAVLRHDTADASISDLWPLSLPRSVRNGSAGTSCRLSTFLGSIRCCKMSTFTLFRCGEAAVAGLVHHETSKVARRVSCGRPEAWHASRFSAHIASAPLCRLDPEMGSAPAKLMLHIYYPGRY